MEVKLIMEERRDNFENKVKEFLENGYKIQNYNITTINTTNSTLKGIAKDYNKILTKDSVRKLCFHALMIKE